MPPTATLAKTPTRKREAAIAAAAANRLREQASRMIAIGGQVGSVVDSDHAAVTAAAAVTADRDEAARCSAIAAAAADRLREDGRRLGAIAASGVDDVAADCMTVTAPPFPATPPVPPTPTSPAPNAAVTAAAADRLRIDAGRVDRRTVAGIEESRYRPH